MAGVREFDMIDTSVSRVWISCEDENTADQERWVEAMVQRCQGRGVSRAVKMSEQEIEDGQMTAKAQSPDAYRWDDVIAEGRGDQFRHGTYLGRQVMDVDDFAAYFAECRGRRSLHCCEVTPRKTREEAPARTRQESLAKRGQAVTAQPSRALGARQVTLVARLREMSADWIRQDAPALRVEGEHRRVPVSIIAAFLVIAISLMLIVSGSVMVAGAKRDVSELRSEVEELERDTELMEDKLEANTNYLSIYETATQKYGMINAAYVPAVYVASNDDISVETFEEDKDVRFGLSTLLSAFGIHLGED